MIQDNGQLDAIYECLHEIVDTLCYQPEIPLAHKTDMINKFLKVAKTFHIRDDEVVSDI